MTILLAVLVFLLGIELGVLGTYLYLNETIISPLKEQHQAALEGWEETMGMAKMLSDIVTSEGEVNLKSPIQIKRIK